MARNRRIGLSMSGIAQYLGKNKLHYLERLCEETYKHIQNFDFQLSTKLQVNKSIKTTSIKPSGTVSLLAGATPGVHYAHSPFYIRRIRIPKNSNLLP